MPRGIRSAFPLVFLCSLLAGCGHFRPSPQTAPKRPPALVLSLPAGAVYLIDPSTGQPRTVATGLSNFQAGYASWNPAHREIAFGDGSIVLFDPRTNVQRRLVRGKDLSMPAWSPDGRTLAYGDGISMWVTGTGTAHAHPYRFRIPAVLAPLEMAWSSTGLIAFEGLRLDCSRLVRCASTGFSEIWTILSDGTGLTQVTRLGHAEKPRWSPDGTRLLFVRTYARSRKRSEVWTARADGSGVRRLISTRDVVAAAWSPDGTQLALVRRGEKPETLQLWIGRGDGSRMKPVGRPLDGSDATLDW